MEFHHNASSDMFSYIAMMFGLWLCALFFGEVAVIAHHGDRAGWDFRVRLKAILETMSSNGLPDKLQKRVKVYYDYLWMNNLHGKTTLVVVGTWKKKGSHYCRVFLFVLTNNVVSFFCFFFVCFC